MNFLQLQHNNNNAIDEYYKRGDRIVVIKFKESNYNYYKGYYGFVLEFYPEKKSIRILLDCPSHRVLNLPVEHVTKY